MRLSGRIPNPIEWICLAGGLFLIFRYLWILDDAFVYFRCVDNLLFLGHGLVFNQGEFVEGYSSPLWALLLIVVRSTQLDYWFLTKALAVVLFVSFWVLMVVLHRRMAPRVPGTNVPLVYLSFAYGPLCYFSCGLETPLVQVIAVAYALFALRPSSRALQIAVALSPMIRHELAVPFLLCAGWWWIRERRIPWLMIGSATAFLAPWMLFRVIYYADFFPNTFYLKNDDNWGQGFLYFVQTFGTYSFHWLVVVFAGLALLLRRWQRAAAAPSDAAAAAERGQVAAAADAAAPNHAPADFDPQWSARGLMILCALSVTVYVIKIGGDPDHYRHLAYPFVLFTCALGGLAEGAILRIRANLRPWTALGAAVAVGAVAFSSVPPQLDRHPVTGDEVHKRVDKIGDPSWHRHHKNLEFTDRRAGEDQERRAYYRQLKARPTSDNFRNCTLCFPAYVDMGTRYIHRFGLTDALLARTDAKPDRPAHKYSLANRARDLASLLEGADPIDAGLYRRAVNAGEAPEWIVEGIESIDVVTRKIYNRHHFLENLRLAFTFPDRIHVPDWRDDPEDTRIP